MDIRVKELELKASMRDPITRIQARTHRRIQAYKCYTVYDLKRLEECIRLYHQSIDKYIETGKENDGLFGVIVEITSHRPASTLIHVRQQTKVDSYVIIDDRPHKMEVKTNDGEMQDFYKLSSSEKAVTYIHYVLDTNVKPSKFCPSGLYQVEFVCTMKHFLERCEQYNAVKDNGENIRGAKCNLRMSKKLYNAFLEDLANDVVIPFDRRMTYTKEDFED